MTVPQKPGAGPGDPRDGGHGHGRLSSQRATLAQLAAEPADILVIGGGITGAGVARDAAMRGLRVVLVDQSDLGSGTSSRSSRLVHGGLRYLETGDLRLVLEANRERRILLRIAPHLVWPLPFVFPLHRGDRLSLWRLNAGMWLYDLLALFRNVRMHRMLGKRAHARGRADAAGARAPGRGAILRRPVRRRPAGARHGPLGDASRRAGRQLHRGALAGADRGPGGRRPDRGPADRRPRDDPGQRRGERHRAVGRPGPHAWRTPEPRRCSSRPRGSTSWWTGAASTIATAIMFLSPIDGRVLFILPWRDLSYIGTTDTDTDESPDQLQVTADEMVYLLRSANARFPNARLGLEDVRGAWAGLRPLLADSAASDGERALARARDRPGLGRDDHRRRREAHHLPLDGEGGGGPRGARASAPRGAAARGRNRTDEEPLPGGETDDFAEFRARGLELGVVPESVEHLIRHYGTEAAGIYNLGAADRRLLRRLVPPHPAIEAEVLHAVRRELAQTVEDVMVRRLHLYFEHAGRGVAAAPRVAELMGRERGWDEARVAEEAARYVEFARR